MLYGRKTLTRYTIEQEHKHPGVSGEFSSLLNSLATVIKIISNQVNKGALVGALGNAGTEGASVNVQGLGVAGYNPPVMWGVYIVTFVFWVGIAHAGTLISAILYLFRAKWRNAITVATSKSVNAPPFR